MKRTAFTLIELLVVIAIISLLAAILFPVFAQAKTSAKQTGDVSNVHQLSVANHLYLTDWDDMHFPLYYVDTTKQSKPSNFGLWRWPWLLFDYTRNFEVFASPADQATLAFIANRGTNGWGYLFGLSPSWGYNQRFYSPLDPTTGQFVPITASAVPGPSRSILLASSYWGTTPNDPKTGYYRLYPPAEWAGAPPLTGLSYGHVWPRFRGTHVATLFGDGHIKVVHLNLLRDEALWRGGE